MTQEKKIKEIGFNPILLGGKVADDGRVFKPDTCLNSSGRCARCGKPGYWIAGAGEYLCHKHQDDY